MNAQPFRLTGWHVLAGMVLFFGADIAINVGFIVKAVQTFPGEVAADPYEAGVAYDRTLAQEAAEQKLGWTATLGAEEISVHWSDRSGRPLTGLAVGALMRRPATEAQNQTLRFAETSAGSYRALARVTAGAWDLDVTASDGRGHQRTASRRLVW